MTITMAMVIAHLVVFMAGLRLIGVHDNEPVER
jgi:hypothetical protein